MTGIEKYKKEFKKVFNKVEESGRSLEAFESFLQTEKEPGQKSLAEVIFEQNQEHTIDLIFAAFNKYFQVNLYEIFSTDKISTHYIYHPVVVWYIGMVRDLCIRYKKDNLGEEHVCESEDLEGRHTTFNNGTIVDNVVDFDAVLMMLFDALMFDASRVMKLKIELVDVVRYAENVLEIQDYFDDSDREDDDDLSENVQKQEKAVDEMRKHVYEIFDMIMTTKLFMSSQKYHTDEALQLRVLHPQTPNKNAPFCIIDRPDVEQAKKQKIQDKKRAMKKAEDARKRAYAEKQLKIAEANLKKAKRVRDGQNDGIAKKKIKPGSKK